MLMSLLTGMYMSSTVRRLSVSKELGEEGQYLATVVESAPIVLHALDGDGKITLSVGQGLKALELEPGQLVGQSVLEAYRDTPSVVADNRRALSGERFTSVLELGDATFETHYAPVMDNSGNVEAMIAVGVDITSRRHAEGEIAKLAKFPEENPNPVMRISSDGVIQYANSPSAPLTGVLGHVGEVVSQSFRPVINDCLDSKSLQEIDINAGQQVYACVLWPDEEGEYVNVYATDVTEAKASQDALEASHTRLSETLTALREAQEQLVQQERLRALGTMASGIAHDFNNALSPILGYTELLLGRTEILNDKEKVTRYLESMNTAAKDATQVVSRMRDFYRHRDEKTDAFVPVNLNAVVANAISLSQPRWKDMVSSKGIDIRLATELASDPPAVLGNDAELRTALTNLIFNAVDAMPEGGTLTLSTRLAQEEAVIEVSDTGMGMTNEVKARALEPFFTTKAGSGTGLGLASVFGTMQRHGGTIDIQSAPGEGTTVILRFLLDSSAKQSSVENKTTTRQESQRILVVDDEAALRDLLREYLGGDGHIVQTATDGREGLQKFKKDEYDVVLTDRGMPEMSGDQLAAAIKELAPEIPVIMLTGFGEMMEVAEEKPVGVDIILSKPVTLSQLREAMEKVTR